MHQYSSRQLNVIMHLSYVVYPLTYVTRDDTILCGIFLSFILDEGITILPRTNVLSAITASLAKSYAEVNRERVLEIIALLSREGDCF